jgi:hypothetical protein
MHNRIAFLGNRFPVKVFINAEKCPENESEFREQVAKDKKQNTKVTFFIFSSWQTLEKFGQSESHRGVSKSKKCGKKRSASFPKKKRFFSEKEAEVSKSKKKKRKRSVSKNLHFSLLKAKQRIFVSENIIT